MIRIGLQTVGRIFAISSLSAALAAAALGCSGGTSEETEAARAAEAPETDAILCPEIVLPVCAAPPSASGGELSYGVTYLNGCWAKVAGATILAWGPCPAAGQSCGGAGESSLCVEGCVCGCPSGSTCVAGTETGYECRAPNTDAGASCRPALPWSIPIPVAHPPSPSPPVGNANVMSLRE